LELSFSLWRNHKKNGGNEVRERERRLDLSFRLKIALNADASPALRVASPALSTWNFQKNGNQCRNFRNAGAPPAVRVGHPQWGLSQISGNAVYTEKPPSAAALTRSAGRSPALGT